MKKIIITGAAGFIGRYLLMTFLMRGYEVCAVVRSDERCDDLKQFLFRNDIDDIASLSFVVSDLSNIRPELFVDMDYDAWFHLAWAGVNREQIENEEIQSRNVEFSKKCLQCAYEMGCSYFGDFGSRAEYPADIGIVEEDMPERSLNKYGVKKREFYEYAYNFCKAKGMKYTHYRIFSVFGPDDHPWSLVMTACKNFKRNEPMEFGACTQMWNYIDVRDLAELVIRVYERLFERTVIRDHNGIVNVANKESRPLIDYVREIHEICNSSSDMKFGPIEGFASKPKLATIEMLNIKYDEISFRESILTILDTI